MVRRPRNRNHLNLNPLRPHPLPAITKHRHLMPPPSTLQRRSKHVPLHPPKRKVAKQYKSNPHPPERHENVRTVPGQKNTSSRSAGIHGFGVRRNLYERCRQRRLCCAYGSKLVAHPVVAQPNAAAPLLDARVWTEHDFGPQGTWSGWNPTFIGKRIDYVFVKNAARVLQHAVLPHEWQGRVASDHFPVLAEVSLHAGAEPRTCSMVHLWRMMPDDQGNGEALGYLKPEFDDRKWPTISAGDAWERQGHPNLDGVVFLRKKIYVPSSWRHRTVQFVTAGIADMYSLHVNGVKVHEAGSKSENVWADRINLHLANSTLDFGAENTFVLRVTDFGGLGGLVGHPLLLTIDDRQPTHSSAAFATRVLVPEQRLEIPDASGKVELEVAIPAYAAKPGGNAALAWLRVGFSNGDEPSGGMNLRCELRQADGTVVHRGISDQKGTVWLQHQVDYGSKWQVVIAIADTDDPDAAAVGSTPGKGCSITVALKIDAGK